MVAVGEGVGPVHALDQALRNALTERVSRSLAGIHLVDYKVRILDGRAATSAVTRVMLTSADHRRRVDDGRRVRRHRDRVLGGARRRDQLRPAPRRRADAGPSAAGARPASDWACKAAATIRSGIDRTLNLNQIRAINLCHGRVSGPLTTGPARAPQRAMLRAVGLSEDDLTKLPQVAVASSWNEVTPCNLHLNGLAAAAKEGVRQAGAVPIEFGTIAVSDGIAMGHEGMKASLVSREVIADSVELMVHAERFDALVAIAGCDKSLPGMLMACARLNVPAAFLYGGTILPGTRWAGR